MSDLLDIETVTHNDLERFAEALGLDGQDADLFYEAYYNLDSQGMEVELAYTAWPAE